MDFKIPLFDLNFDEREEQAVLETLRSKWISMGPKTAALEERLREALGCRYALGVASCTAALHLGMKLLGIGEGDEVIVPSLTFVATVNAARYVGATPVFCDVKGAEDLTLDPEMLETLITPKTKAIAVMHYGGFPCDMAQVMEIARKYNLKMLEDACHGPLSEYGGQKLGTIGDIGCFSFFSNKNISAGEGGALTTNNPEYFERAKLLRSHGMTSLSYERAKGHSSAYDVVDLGYNYRLDDIRAAIALAQLEKLPADLEKRQAVRRWYVERLKEAERVVVPFEGAAGYVSNYIFPVVLRDSTAALRDEVRNQLAAAGIQTSVHYPAAHRFSIYQPYHRGNLPQTEYAADNELTLPMYGSLTEAQVDWIAETLKEILKKIG